MHIYKSSTFFLCLCAGKKWFKVIHFQYTYYNKWLIGSPFKVYLKKALSAAPSHLGIRSYLQLFNISHTSLCLFCNQAIQICTVVAQAQATAQQLLPWAIYPQPWSYINATPLATVMVTWWSPSSIPTFDTTKQCSWVIWIILCQLLGTQQCAKCHVKLSHKDIFNHVKIKILLDGIFLPAPWGQNEHFSPIWQTPTHCY